MVLTVRVQHGCSRSDGSKALAQERSERGFGGRGEQWRQKEDGDAQREASEPKPCDRAACYNVWHMMELMMYGSPGRF